MWLPHERPAQQSCFWKLINSDGFPYLNFWQKNYSLSDDPGTGKEALKIHRIQLVDVFQSQCPLLREVRVYSKFKQNLLTEFNRTVSYGWVIICDILSNAFGLLGAYLWVSSSCTVLRLGTFFVIKKCLATISPFLELEAGWHLAATPCVFNTSHHLQAQLWKKVAIVVFSLNSQHHNKNGLLA